MRRWKLAALALMSSAAAAQDDVVAYGIAQFGGTGECGTAGMTHPVHVDTAAAFAGAFNFVKQYGGWGAVYTRNNGLARSVFFADGSKQSSGADTTPGYGIDSVDVLYVHTHGNRSLVEKWTSLTMGNSLFDCSVRTDQDLFFGGGAKEDLDIAVIKACQSGDYDVWLAGGYTDDIAKPNSSFTMWNAFHGDSSCGDHVTDYIGDYAYGSFANGVGENWLDAAYDNDGDDDDCPVSIVLGSTADARHHRFEWGGFTDREDTGSKTGSSYYFFSGCTPTHGRTLP